jgi:hypothetical protein
MAGATAPPRPARRPLRTWVFLLVALVVPLAIAVAWIPIRATAPNTDLALILVATVAAVGACGRRPAVLVAAVTAALWFDFFDTAPYGQLAISRNPDIETTIVLVIVAVMAGELAIWTVRHLKAMRNESEELSSVRQAAELVASGEELVRVIEAVGAELKRLLLLDRVTFEASEQETSDLTGCAVTREGRLEPAPVQTTEQRFGASLGVVVQGEELGRYELSFGPQSSTSRERLLVATTLADQVGAAFLAQAPPPLPPAGLEPAPGLRVVTGDGAARPRRAGRRAQETAGLSSTRDRMIS